MLIDLYREIPTNLLYFMLILCVGAGWMLDNAMRGAGAGMIGNALLLSAGAVGGLLFAALFGVDLKKATLEAVAFAMGGAIWLLLVGCFVKSRVSI